MIDRNPLENTMEEEIPPRKMKKTRRGKKKRSKSLAENSGCVNEDDEFLTPYGIPKERKQRLGGGGKSRSLRPIQVPKAPKNSTQFIIDDHEDSNLYMSFEGRVGNSSAEDDQMFAGFQDIDYEYESPDDLDTNAFYAKDFETIYRRFREEELMSMPRKIIMERCLELEQRVWDLESRVSHRDLNVVIARFQEKLLSLQEENSLLKKHKLTLSCKALSLSEKEDDEDGKYTMNESSDEPKDMTVDDSDEEESSE